MAIHGYVKAMWKIRVDSEDHPEDVNVQRSEKQGINVYVYTYVCIY